MIYFIASILKFLKIFFMQAQSLVKKFSIRTVGEKKVQFFQVFDQKTLEV